MKDIRRKYNLMVDFLKSTSNKSNIEWSRNHWLQPSLQIKFALFKIVLKKTKQLSRQKFPGAPTESH